jgi:uncharacterized membrane protein YqaE (UPF0057 family)
MMKRNWIALLLALVALASCSVEKRVYQPGYHIEWNHFAKQDASRDVAQDASQDVAQDAERDASHDLSENLETDVTQDLSENLSKNLETGASKGSIPAAIQGGTARSRIEKTQRIIQAVSPAQLNSFKAESKLGQSKNSDFEFVLLIILALFLPALTIFLLEGIGKNFWIAFSLMILAFALPISSYFVRGMIMAIATILAISVVFHYR